MDSLYQIGQGVGTTTGIMYEMQNNNQVPWFMKWLNRSNTVEASLDSAGNFVSAGTVTALSGNSTNWNTAFTQTERWNGGSTDLVAATGRTSLGLLNGALADTTLWVCDTVLFNTTKTRASKFIKGLSTTSRFTATRYVQAEALPVAGDLPMLYYKTDTLVITRAAGTTSGAIYTIIGHK